MATPLEKATDSAKPTKDNPFSIGMEDWFTDSDSEDFQAPKAKKARKSSSSSRDKSQRFAMVTEEEAKKSAKGVVPANTAKNDQWALNTFKAWLSERNTHSKELCPDDVLVLDDAVLLNKWLSLFVMEVRKLDGSPYPPSTIHLILCGLQRFMRRSNVSPVNIFNKHDVRF